MGWKASALLLFLGCNRSALDTIPSDAATSGAVHDLSTGTGDEADLAGADLSAPDLSLAPRPCTLVAAGEPVVTVSYSDPQSSWHCEGLLGRSSARNRVIHYGSVRLRFGGWDDPAIIATELDVTSWPPTVIRAPTEFWYSMHSPAAMFELGADRLGLTWSFDNDGIGPAGIQFRTLDAQSWNGSAIVFISDYHWGQGTPVPLKSGDQFAIPLRASYTDPTMSLSIRADDGTKVQEALLTASGSSATVALERLESDLFAVVAYSTCAPTDPAFCEANSLVILRASGGTSAQSPLKLDKVAAIAARNPKQSLFQPVLLSDRQRGNFLLWWEMGSAGSYLFATPLSAQGLPSGPVEVWFTTTAAVVTPGRASIGAVGAVVPVALYVSSDAGNLREVHLIQRQMVVDAPVHDVVFSTLESSFAISTAQADDPRALIVGYSNYPMVSGNSGFGAMAKYVCAED